MAPAAPSGPRRGSARRLAASAARRLGWGVADQVVSSLTNYAVSFCVVLSLGAAQFGAFSLAYVTYGFALNASRGLCTDPLMIRFSGRPDARWRAAVAGSTGTAIAAGTVAGLLALAAAALVRGTAGEALAALGCTLPLLMLQDCWRYAFFTGGRGCHALLNDSVWAGTLLPALWLLRETRHAGVFWFTLAWGGSAGVAAALGPLQARVLPRPARSLQWLRDHRDLGTRYMLEGLSNNVAFQVRNYGTSALAGLAVVGYVQASVTLMGPVTILFLGMGLVAIPEAARVLRRSPPRLPAFCLLVTAGLSAAAVGWGVVLLAAVPRGLGEALLGRAWHGAYPLIVPQIAFAVSAGAATGASVGLHALGAARRSLRLVVCIAIMTSAGTFAGTCLDGGRGTITGMAVASWIGTALTWWQFGKAMRDARVPAPAAGRGGAGGGDRAAARRRNRALPG